MGCQADMKARPGAGVLDLPYFLLLATFSVYIAAHRSVTANKRQQITLSQASCRAILDRKH